MAWRTPLPTVETSYARRMFGVGFWLESGSCGKFPKASLAHRIPFDVPFADNERIPPGMPPGDDVPHEAVAVPRAIGLAPKWPAFLEKTRTLLFSPCTKSMLSK